MDAYKPYVEFIMAGGVAETAYILSKEGALCGTNLPIQALPSYEFDLVDQNNPDVKNKVVVDEKNNLLEAIANHGVAKHKAGVRLYNQKYYTVHAEDNTFYMKKDKGGACICLTKSFILIGTFNTEIKMQNGVAQNPGELNKRVQTLAKDLLSKGS